MTLRTANLTPPTTQTSTDRASWERAMRQLTMCNRLLATGLVALCARLVISGPAPVPALSATLLALLLLASLLLTRYGRRHQPAVRSSPTRGGPPPQRHTGRC